MTKIFYKTKKLFTGELKGDISDEKQLTELMRLTREELSRIERNYKEVTDEDLLDYFMYCRLAAQQKYNYLIKQYRAHGLNVDEQKECV